VLVDLETGTVVRRLDVAPEDLKPPDP